MMIHIDRLLTECIGGAGDLNKDEIWVCPDFWIAIAE
jgi:hypothetical protein